VGALEPRTQSETCRFYNCIRCHDPVWIGSCCDEGHVHCKKCSKELEAGRKKSARYQKTAAGRRNHTLCMRRMRRRRRRKPLRADTLSDAIRRLKAHWQQTRHGRGGCPRPPSTGAGRQRAPCQSVPCTRARCAAQRRPPPCQRRHAHPRRERDASARRQCQGAFRVQTRCERKQIGCRLSRRRPGRARSADKLTAEVTHQVLDGSEPAGNIPGPPQDQPQLLDVPTTRVVSPGSKFPALCCSICGRALSPSASPIPWRGSG
jgi:hypothetical protein